MGIKDSQTRRGRTKYTTEQLYALERAFCISQYPDTATMEDLADLCNVSVEKISTWFQNRRSKFKRQSKDTNITWMRKHVFSKDPLAATKAAGSHVLSPPSTEATTCTPKSNLNYLPVVTSSYLPPPTPFYPPVVPYDMFSDISGDFNATTVSSLFSQTMVPEEPSTHTTSHLHASSPKIQHSSPPGLSPYSLPVQISPLQCSASPPHVSPSSLDQSCMLNSSSDTSSSSQQSTSSPNHQMSPVQGHPDFHSYYLNQSFPWYYYQCTYRR